MRRGRHAAGFGGGVRRGLGVIAAGLLAAWVGSAYGTAAVAGEWWDPSGALALPPVQNAICQNTGVLCSRVDRVRLDTVDYAYAAEDPLLTAGGANGWWSFLALDGQRASFCIDHRQIDAILYRYRDFDGNTLRVSGSTALGRFSQRWDFRPIMNWLTGAPSSGVYRITASPHRQIIFDIVSSMRYPAPRDIGMTVQMQVLRGGFPDQKDKATYNMRFYRGEDQTAESCLLPALGPGDYLLTFLVSDDSFGEDKPIPVQLQIGIQ